MDAVGIATSMMARYSGAVEGVMHDYYPPGSTVTTIFDNYLAQKAVHDLGQYLDVKRTVYVEGFWANFGDPAVVAAYLTGEIHSPGWLHYRGRPVVGVFDATLWATTYLADWAIFKAGLPSNTYFIALGQNVAAHLTTLGVHGWAAYGPNGSLVAGNGQHPWSVQLTANQATWGASGGRDVILSYTPAGDQRARKGNPNGVTTPWSDPPMGLEFMAAMATRRDLIQVFYAGTEHTEGGAGNLWSSAQRAGLLTQVMRMLRQTPISRPSSYVDKLSACSLFFTRAGAPVWSRNESGGVAIAGAFDSEILWLTADTDSITATFQYVKRIELLGPRGAGIGSFTITIDGGAPVVVDANTGSGQLQPIFDSGALVEGSHTIVIAGHATNAGLGRRAGANLIQITQNPQSFPYFIDP